MKSDRTEVRALLTQLLPQVENLYESIEDNDIEMINEGLGGMDTDCVEVSNLLAALAEKQINMSIQQRSYVRNSPL